MEQSAKVKLDEQEVDIAVLHQRIQEVEAEKTGKKIVEVTPGVWKTLTRLHG
jgi:hypothetical protein